MKRAILVAVLLLLPLAFFWRTGGLAPVVSPEAPKEALPLGKDIAPAGATTLVTPEKTGPEEATPTALPSFRGPPRDVLLKNPDGRPFYSGLREAGEACAKRGMRLPTIRELAALGQARGAKGIREPDQIMKEETGVEAPAYVRILTTEADGTQDEFFYDGAGYDEPDETIRAQISHGRREGGTFNDPDAAVVMIMQYWSSSRYRGGRIWPEYFFFGLSGHIFAHSRRGVSLVRCVAEPR